MRTMFVSAWVAVIAGPVLAAEFYIVQDIAKQTCAVAPEPPKDDKHVRVGEGAYNDEAVATSDMQKMFACNPRDATSGVAPQSPTGLKTQP